MAIKKSDLYSSLWASCDELRGGMDASQYKDYVLTMLFVKYVSDKYAGNPMSLIEVPEDASFEGISEKVNWKSSGSFVYTELAQNNAGYIDAIQAAKKSKALIKIWDEIKDKGFIGYKISPQGIDNSFSKCEELTLDDQKKLLVSLLDKNQLYVNYSNMEDADYQIKKKISHLIINSISNE